LNCRKGGGGGWAHEERNRCCPRPARANKDLGSPAKSGFISATNTLIRGKVALNFFGRGSGTLARGLIPPSLKKTRGPATPRKCEQGSIPNKVAVSKEVGHQPPRTRCPRIDPQKNRNVPSSEDPGCPRKFFRRARRGVQEVGGRQAIFHGPKKNARIACHQKNRGPAANGGEFGFGQGSDGRGSIANGPISKDFRPQRDAALCLKRVGEVGR